MIKIEIPGVIDFYQTGSRYICNPPVTGTDDDYIVLVNDQREFFEDAVLSGYKYSQKDSCAEHSDFLSFRNGDINLVVTDSKDFFDKFNAATEVAKRLNLLNKSDRIMLFQAVLYGKEPCEIALASNAPDDRTPTPDHQTQDGRTVSVPVHSLVGQVLPEKDTP